MLDYIEQFPDELSGPVNAYFEAKHATTDDKIWWVLLYSACYCAPTACVLAEHLDYRTLTKEKADRFWNKNKPKLLFQSDRRYIKHMNQFVAIVTEFVERSKRQPNDYLGQFVNGDAHDNYCKLYREVSRWTYYGRFGIILFLYNINKFVQLPLDYHTYDWQHGATTTAAIFNAFYRDDDAQRFEEGGVSLGKKMTEQLDSILLCVMAQLRDRTPSKTWTIMNVTSDLCSYRKMYKGSRYLGYYVDRALEETRTLEGNYPKHQWIWDLIYKARVATLDPRYLGEANDWTGIRKPLMRSWLDHGRFV